MNHAYDPMTDTVTVPGIIYYWPLTCFIIVTVAINTLQYVLNIINSS